MINNEWLLENLQVQSTIFHIGRYCGSWKSSASGHGKSSYHIVMEGGCWLHTSPPELPIWVNQGDVVFILQDCPFILSDENNYVKATRSPTKSMVSLAENVDQSTALTCGFITFTSPVSKVILSFFPEVIILRKDDDLSGSVKNIIEVIHKEAFSEQFSSQKLISSLAEILFFIAIRKTHTQDKITTPLDKFDLSSEFLGLFASILRQPEKEWSIPEMAAQSGMSRSWFIHRFRQVMPLTPAETVRYLKISVASRMIDKGHHLNDVAAAIGYLSVSAFNRAFKRVTGFTPGYYRLRNRVVQTVRGSEGE